MTLTTLATLVTIENLKSEIANFGFPAPNTDDKTELLGMAHRLAAIRSQADMATFAINVTQGGLTADDLTQILREAFPTAKVGDRHGKHFASNSRTGKLKNCRFAVAKGVRTASRNAADKARIEELTNEIAKRDAVLEQIAKCAKISEVRKVLKAFATADSAESA